MYMVWYCIYVLLTKVLGPKSLRQIATKCIIWRLNEQQPDSPNCKCSIFAAFVCFCVWCANTVEIRIRITECLMSHYMLNRTVPFALLCLQNITHIKHQIEKNFAENGVWNLAIYHTIN